MMRSMGRLRMILATIAVGILLTTAGCGQTFIQAVKDGMFSFVSGSLSSFQLPTQLADFFTDFVTSGGSVR